MSQRSFLDHAPPPPRGGYARPRPNPRPRPRPRRRSPTEVFRTPDLQAALYFAFFILTDPPTSPVKYRDQIVCGVIVALVSYAVFEWVGAVYYLLAGVLVGNIWEAWRRTNLRRIRQTSTNSDRNSSIVVAATRIVSK